MKMFNGERKVVVYILPVVLMAVLIACHSKRRASCGVGRQLGNWNGVVPDSIIFGEYRPGLVEMHAFMRVAGDIYLGVLGNRTGNYRVDNDTTGDPDDNLVSDVVPDEATAIRIAEAIWLPKYGSKIYTDLPFKAALKDSTVWIVSGTMPPRMKGGTPYIEIRKRDCRILKVTHFK